MGHQVVHLPDNGAQQVGTVDVATQLKGAAQLANVFQAQLLEICQRGGIGGGPGEQHVGLKVKVLRDKGLDHAPPARKQINFIRAHCVQARRQTVQDVVQGDQLVLDGVVRQDVGIGMP